MRIECSECGAAYNVHPAETSRRATCKKCGASMTIPTAAATLEPLATEAVAPPPPPRRAAPTPPPLPTTREEREERRRAERPARPGVAVAVAVVSFLQGGVLVPRTIYMGLGVAAGAAEGGVEGGALVVATYFLVVMGIVGAGLLGGGIGLLLQKSWGWWASTSIYCFSALFNAKMLLPLTHLRWEHPRAGDAFWAYFIAYGIPFLVASTMLVLLMLPRMRMAYGVKQQSTTRRRGARRVASRG